MPYPLKYFAAPTDAPAWVRALFRWFPAPLLTALTLLAGCMPATPSTNAPTQPGIAWETLAPGLERRFLRPGGSYALTQFIVLRIDPSQYSFRVHYHPGAPLSIIGWHDALPDAVAFVNANYFDPEHHALGLVVADGVAYGNAYQKFGGMLQVQNDIVSVHSNTFEPYTGESLEEAVQAFPMLIANQQAAFSDTQGDRVTRRTVVGQDSQGRILLIVSSALMGMRLVDLSHYLASTDLDLVNAVNLDGGGSSMLWLSAPGQQDYPIPSLDPVPTVLAIYAR